MNVKRPLNEVEGVAFKKLLSNNVSRMACFLQGGIKYIQIVWGKDGITHKRTVNERGCIEPIATGNYMVLQENGGLAEQMSLISKQKKQELMSSRNTTVKLEHVTLPKCRLNTTIALCFSSESTVLDALQYEQFMAHQKSRRTQSFSVGKIEKGPLQVHVAITSVYILSVKVQVCQSILYTNLEQVKLFFICEALVIEYESYQ